MIVTTLKELDGKIDFDGQLKLLDHLGKTKEDHEPLEFVEVLDVAGYEKSLYAFNQLYGRRPATMLFTLWCVRRSQHLADPEVPMALDLLEKIIQQPTNDWTQEREVIRKISASVERSVEEQWKTPNGGGQLTACFYANTAALDAMGSLISRETTSSIAHAIAWNKCPEGPNAQVSWGLAALDRLIGAASRDGPWHKAVLEELDAQAMEFRSLLLTDQL